MPLIVVSHSCALVGKLTLIEYRGFNRALDMIPLTPRDWLKILAGIIIHTILVELIKVHSQLPQCQQP